MKCLNLLGVVLCLGAVWIGLDCVAVTETQPGLVETGDVLEDPESIAEAEIGALLIRARYFINLGEVDKAKETYQQIISKFPGTAYAYFQLANLLLGTDEIDLRIQNLEKTVELDPTMKEAYESLGLAYRIKEENSKAIATYKKAIQETEDNLSFYSSLADAYIILDQTKEAEDVLLEACEKHHDSPEAWFKLLEFYVSSRQEEKADESLEKALKATSNNLRLLRDARSLYLRWKNDEKALAVLVKTLELYPESPELWFQLVRHYLVSGEKEKAQEATQKAFTHVRYDETLYTSIAVAYIDLSDWASAIDILEQATKYHADSVEIWRTLARLYDRTGEKEKARECYRKILTVEPTRIQERRLYALSYVAEGDYKRGIEELQKAIRLFPKDVRLKVDTANAYQASGQFEEGEKIYLDLIRDQPGNSDIQLLLATYYYKADMRDKMLETVESAVAGEKEAAKQARIYSIMGQAALEKADTATAVKFFQEAAKLEPGSPAHAYALAGTYFLLKDREKAVEQLEKAVKLAPRPNPDWLLTLGQTYRSFGKKEEASASFSKAITLLQQECERQPKSWQAQYQLGQAYETAEEDELAAEAYEKSVRLEPGNGDLRYKLAALYNELYQHEKAQTQLEEAIDREPRSPKPEWFLLLGEEYRTQTKNDEAGKAFQKAIDLLKEEQGKKPEDPRIWAALGEAFSRAQRYEEAVGAFREAVKFSAGEPSFSLYVALGRALDASGKGDAAMEEYGKAVAFLENAVKEKPEDSGPFLQLGLVYQRVNAFVKSSEALSKGIELSAGDATYTSHVALAESLSRCGEDEKAKVQYEKAYSMLLEIVKEHPTRIWAHYMLANVCDKLEKLDECEAAYKKVMELDPFLAAAYNNLGYSWIERNIKIEEALKLIQKALELEPENGAYIDSLGWGYFKQGKLDEALAELQRSLKFESTDPTIYDHLGDVYKAKKMIKEAIEHWEKALEMNPHQQKIKEKIEKNRGSLPPT